MQTLDDLRRALQRIDGRSYPAYKAVAGRYQAGGFQLWIDHVQGDPFAAPSELRVVLTPGESGLPEWSLRDRSRRVSAADFLTRTLGAAFAGGHSRGSGRSGELRVLRPGQEVLERTSVLVGASGRVEARFTAGLPARGRRVLAREAAALLTGDVPGAVEAALRFSALDPDALRRQLEAVEDAQALRAQLEPRGLVAFVAEGALLPRRSGVDDRPLAAERAVPFAAPEPLRVELEAPNAGRVRGMGIPRGVTLIVGGGFHGKSTLLRALERGVYDHVPGDGRERVVTLASAVKVRAEDGRAVAGADISAFIGRLPGGQDTRAFATANASGSTSQAAAVVEALEVGARCLLIDEDTSATNFMIRDARMQALIADAHEPITPFIDRARALADVGVSTVVVVGGSGDYFDVADAVIALQDYLPRVVTDEARAIAARLPTARRTGAAGAWRAPAARVPLPESFDPGRGRRELYVKTPTEERAVFGDEEVSLAAVDQLVESGQVRAIAHALAWARGTAIDGRRPLDQALHEAMAALERDGLSAIQRRPSGDLAAFRIFELAAFLNRLRSLRTRPAPGEGASSDVG